MVESYVPYIRIGDSVNVRVAALNLSVPGKGCGPADVLGGNFDPALFADRIVLVGTSAAGVINDRQATPIAREVPGSEDSCPTDRADPTRRLFLRSDWAVGAEILFTLLCGIGLILGVSRIGALPSAILGAADVVAVVGIYGSHSGGRSYRSIPSTLGRSSPLSIS